MLPFTELVRSGCVQPDGRLTEGARGVLGLGDYARIFCEPDDLRNGVSHDYPLNDLVYCFQPESGLIVGGDGRGRFRVINDPRIANLVEDFRACSRDKDSREDEDNRERLPLGKYGTIGTLGSVAIAACFHLAGASSDQVARDVLLVTTGSVVGMGIDFIKGYLRSDEPFVPMEIKEKWLRHISRLLDNAEPLVEVNHASDTLPDCESGELEGMSYVLRKAFFHKVRTDGGAESVNSSATRKDIFFADIYERMEDLDISPLLLAFPLSRVENVFGKFLFNTPEFIDDPHYLPAVIELLEARQRALDAYHDIRVRVSAARAREQQGIALRTDKELLKGGLSDENTNNPFGKDEMGEVNRRYQQAWLEFIDIYARIQHAHHFERLREDIVAMLPETTRAASDHEFPVVRVIWDELSNAMSEITEPTKENVALLGDIKDTIATLPKTLPFAELYELYEKIYYKFAPRLRTLMTPSEFRRTYPGVADGVV